MIKMFIIGLFLILFYLLKKSKSDFFFQDTEVLAVKRYHLIEVLYDFEISQQKINDYLEAFNFFASNPELFDGATIVKDLPTIKRLDLPALKHDFDYLTNNFWSWNGLKNKIQYDWNYGQNQEELTVGSLTAYTRSILLILSTPLYYLMIIFKK